MSHCGRTQSLEAVVMGEAPHAMAVELRAHAQKCARCRHELNWLESESTLFKQRAGREEVAHLWPSVRQGARHRSSWPRALLAMVAVTALAFLSAGRLYVSPPRPVDAVAQDALETAFESSPLMSPVLFIDEPCSRLPLGVGFQCSPVVPASFIASR